jgi:hypothetical protein
MLSALGQTLLKKEVTPEVAEALWPQIKPSSSSGDQVRCIFASSIPTQLKNILDNVVLLIDSMRLSNLSLGKGNQEKE